MSSKPQEVTVEVIGYFCPECDTSFAKTQLVGGVIVRHKIPRQHPSEQEWDRNERLYPALNECTYIGLPDSRVIGSIVG